MKDPQIREAFFNSHLKSLSDKDFLVFEEVGIKEGKSIVDIALFNPKYLQAFEIKSAQDTAQRLLSQIENYNKVFDSITLITEENHFYDMKLIVPPFWGLIMVSKNFDLSVKFEILRMPKKNPNVCPVSICELLWKDEAVKILKKHGFRGTQKHKRKKLWKMISSNLNIEEIKREVFLTLESRKDWKTPVNKSLK